MQQDSESDVLNRITTASLNSSIKLERRLSGSMVWPMQLLNGTSPYNGTSSTIYTFMNSLQNPDSLAYPKVLCNAK